MKKKSDIFSDYCNTTSCGILCSSMFFGSCEITVRAKFPLQSPTIVGFAIGTELKNPNPVVFILILLVPSCCNSIEPKAWLLFITILGSEFNVLVKFILLDPSTSRPV